MVADDLICGTGLTGNREDALAVEFLRAIGVALSGGLKGGGLDPFRGGLPMLACLGLCEIVDALCRNGGVLNGGVDGREGLVLGIDDDLEDPSESCVVGIVTAIKVSTKRDLITFSRPPWELSGSIAVKGTAGTDNAEAEGVL